MHTKCTVGIVITICFICGFGMNGIIPSADELNRAIAQFVTFSGGRVRIDDNFLCRHPLVRFLILKGDFATDGLQHQTCTRRL